MSLVRNAQRVRFPLLFEAADDEFRAAVESVTALREAGKPADLFVFPGEYHIKWQPAHRLAAYERGLDWFMFWLRGELPQDQRRRGEVERWAAMRRAARSASAISRANVVPTHQCRGTGEAAYNRDRTSASGHLRIAPRPDDLRFGKEGAWTC